MKKEQIYPARLGRPSKYRPKVVNTICDAISDGVPNKFAAALGGISYQTFCEWRRQIPEFSDGIEEALARGIHSRLRRIRKRGEEGNAKSDQWWLEHVLPEYFARGCVETLDPEPEPPIQKVSEFGPPVTTEETVPTPVIKNALRRFLAVNPEEAKEILGEQKQ
jgi:hypothetical protein